MNILGIEFLNESLHRRLETLAAGAWFLMTTLGGYICLLFSIYCLFTSFWWLILLYAFWVYLDRNTCETGGRSIKWIQNLTWWLYLTNYFPARLKLTPNFKLDSNKNYLFCCFPHGVLPAGPYCSITCERSDFHRLYPKFEIKTTALRQLYFLPFTRELGLALGGISCSAKSLCYLLSKPEGGYIAILFPGGASEAFYALPGQHKFVVKNRKGFVRVAIKSGAPLVPVITFGETELFDQVQGPIFQKIQQFVKKCCGFVPVVCIGRGYFQNSFGLIPRRKALTTVVGTPIDVIKNDNPSVEEVEEVHQSFVEQLVKLFETYKYKFLENPENQHLILE